MKMKPTSELIRDPKLWGGLHRPGIPFGDADVAVCGVPFDGGVSFRAGAASAPAGIRNITFSICPTTEDFEIMNLRLLDTGDIEGANRDEIFAVVEARAEEFVRAQKFFTFIGGDHSVTIPIMRGVNRAIGNKFGVIHIDAHFDLCDEQSGDKLSHGCVQRRTLELENIDGAESIFFAGIRSAKTCESEFMRHNPVNVIGASCWTYYAA